MLGLHISAWAPVALLCFYTNVIHDQPSLIFHREFFAWGFNLQTRMGELWHWINFGTNTLTSILEMGFNISAMIYVYKTRKEVQHVVVSENRKREVKLLFQCFIVGCFFVLANVMFTIAFALGWSSRVAFLCTQASWTFNHCVNPLVYFGVNTDLRKSFFRFVSCNKCCKPSNAVVPE